MYGIDAPISERQIVGHDGTRVTYYVAGGDGPLLILAPGLGTPFVSWKFIIEEFHDLYTIMTWDPRGTHRSDTPRDLGNLRLEDHVRDLDAICAAEGWDSFILGGWSMGVQIALEAWHQRPERIRALVLINGAYEHVLRTAFQVPGAERIFTGVLQVARRLGPILNPTLSVVLTMDATLSFLKHTRLLAENAEFFAEVLRDFSGLDFGVYFTMMLLLNEHSAAPYLRTVRVPTLITAGTGDRMTPVATAQKAWQEIPGAELFVIPNGTHYTMTEYPEILNLRLERFLRERDPALFERRDAGRRAAR